MIRVLHGDDSFSIDEAVSRIKETVGPPDVRAPNTSVFEGRFQPGAVLAAAAAVPFLADRRLVMVRGLLGRLDENDKSVGEGWEKLAERLRDIPPTTELVFVETQVLKRGGRGLRAVGPAADVKECQPPRGTALEAWIQGRFASAGAKASSDAVARLAWLTGGDLRLLDQEVQKLALYASGSAVAVQDVNAMVTEAREESIFAAVDAVLERRAGVAMKLMYSLLGAGSTASDILNMIARQVRLTLLAADLSAGGLAADEVGKRIGVTNRFALEKTLRLAGRFSPEYLASIHRRLLAADLSIKTGQLDERLAVELLVAKLAA